MDLQIYTNTIDKFWLEKKPKLIKKLIKIFNKYEEKYNLGIYLSFDIGVSCFYFHGLSINMDLDYVYYILDTIVIRKRHPTVSNFKELAVCVLLHEIGHAIDYKIKGKQLYELYEYEDKKELEADRFANKELEKWVGFDLKQKA